MRAAHADHDGNAGPGPPAALIDSCNDRKDSVLSYVCKRINTRHVAGCRTATPVYMYADMAATVAPTLPLIL